MAASDETHFGRPQDVAFLPDGSALVADGLTNSRIVKLDRHGRYVMATWPNIRSPNHLLVSEATQDVWVGDNMTAEMLKFDTSGKRLIAWDASGMAPGGFGELHHFSVDAEGTVYVADAVLGRLQKLRPKRRADPSQLIGPPKALMRWFREHGRSSWLRLRATRCTMSHGVCVVLTWLTLAVRSVITGAA